MILSLIIRLRSATLMALLVIALAVTSFGHRAPSQKDVSVGAFLISGFTLADLCGSSDAGQSASPVPCLACTPPMPVLIPGSACIVLDADIRLVAAIFAPRARKTVPAVHDPARPPRGPPLV